ncbi:MAG TPA: DUF4097 family beta strand repeat-containing protein [Chloroflexaceae bacterium]|nr:DUF4097 family beta strand repeat-containing protein [Chloroflexaceae bacterium]
MKLNTDSRATEPAPEQPYPPAPMPDEPYYRRGEQSRRWGGLLVLLGVVLLVFALSSRAPVFGIGFVERTAPLDARSFAAERVVLTGVGDQVELVGWSGDEVQVEAVKHGFGWSPGAATQALERLDVELTPRGDTLFIEVRRPIGTIIGRAPYADLRIALPEGAAVEASVVSGDIAVAEVSGDLTLGTVSGDLEARATSGRLVVTTTSGDLDVRDHRGPIAAESVSGDVRLAGDLEDARVKTVSGDVRLDGATGRAEITSISGDLTVAGAGLAALTAETTSGEIEAVLGLAEGATGRIGSISGDVQVRLLEPVSLRLDVTTTSGDLSTNLAGLDEERRSLRGTVGDGGAALTVSTTSGDVVVRGE